MKLTTNSSTITIEGNIKTQADFQSIKGAIESLMSTHKSIHLDLIDTMSISSSVIGFITKVIHKDGINISMSISNERLYDLLNDLNLVKLFNVKKR